MRKLTNAYNVTYPAPDAQVYPPDISIIFEKVNDLNEAVRELQKIEEIRKNREFIKGVEGVHPHDGTEVKYIPKTYTMAELREEWQKCPLGVHFLEWLEGRE